jgi:hypothetical protein
VKKPFKAIFIALRLGLLVFFALLTILQWFSIPGQFRYEAEQNPEQAYLRWPLTILGMSLVLSVQLFIFAIWKLLGLISATKFYSERSIYWFNFAIKSLAALAILLVSTLGYVLSQADDPGFPFLLTLISGAVILFLLSFALLRDQIQEKVAE